ncbi:MAG: hypothetical protein RIF32_23300 [Leptospirales bacterium]|jgi:hypothetical protein
MNARSLLFLGIFLIVPVDSIVVSSSASSFAFGPGTRNLQAQSAGSDGASDAKQLDREFYNDYLDSIPNDWEPDQALLESNLFAAIKRVLPREDPFDAPAYLKTLEPDQLEYKRVSADSPFIRGLFQEAPYLRQTEYMWIIKSGPYMVFLTYRSDPERYTVAEYQNLVIKKKPAEKSGSEHKSPDR